MARILLVFLLGAAAGDDRGWRPHDGATSDAQTVVSEYGDIPNDFDDDSEVGIIDGINRSMMTNPADAERNRASQRSNPNRRTAEQSRLGANARDDSLIIHPDDKFKDLESVNGFDDSDFSSSLTSDESYWDGLFDDAPPNRGDAKNWMLESLDSAGDFLGSGTGQSKTESGMRPVDRGEMPMPPGQRRVTPLPNGSDREREAIDNRNRSRRNLNDADLADLDYDRRNRQESLAQREANRRSRQDIAIPDSFLEEMDPFNDPRYDPDDDISLRNSATASRERDFSRRDDVTLDEDLPEGQRRTVKSPEKEAGLVTSETSEDNDAGDPDQEGESSVEKSLFRLSAETRWGMFVFVSLLLFFSVALNFYLKYLAWDIHNRYQEVVSDLNELESRQDTSLSLESATTDRFSTSGRRAVRA